MIPSYGSELFLGDDTFNLSTGSEAAQSLSPSDLVAVFPLRLGLPSLSQV